MVPLLVAGLSLCAPVAKGQGRVSPQALAALLADASRRNRVPEALRNYRAAVETDLSIVIRQETGNELIGSEEQIASTLRWQRDGAAEQHVVGYRSQQTGPNISMLSAFPAGWLIPSLYGNRLRTVSRTVDDETSARDSSLTGEARRLAERLVRQQGVPRANPDTLLAVHPLATDRLQYYDYTGGDTVVTIRSGSRTIPIVAVRVRPTAAMMQQQRTPVLLFDGELGLDATTGTLVRMRGSFVRYGPLVTGGSGARAAAVAAQSLVREVVAFIELENGEQAGAYWLPVRQRVEIQATSPLLGENRAVIRLVSRFRDVTVNDNTVRSALVVSNDTLSRLRRVRLTLATRDSLQSYSAWRSAFGALVEGLHADDFLEVGPDRWRPTGAPRFDWGTTFRTDLVHFNRVEGVFTGFGGKWSLRDVAPGVVVRGNVGWAWHEQAVRGRLSVARTAGPWTMELRGGRTLDLTNDFRIALDSGNSASALFASQDPYDYVDRRLLTAGVVRVVGPRTWVVRGEVGVADDRYRGATYARSPLGGSAYRANRGVDAGGYLRTALLAEWHPDVSVEGVRPGVGSRLSYERGDGTLNWQRIEGRVVVRRLLGPLLATVRADAGVVLGDRPPPQQLFELGTPQNLTGYKDKEFAGSRAAMLRGSVQYPLKLWQQPIRWQRLLFPAVAPTVSVGVQAGWADAATAGARASMGRLVTPPVVMGLPVLAVVPVFAPGVRETGGVRGAVSAGVRFFGGGVFVGASRPVDHGAPWRALVVVGQAW